MGEGPRTLTAGSTALTRASRCVSIIYMPHDTISPSGRFVLRIDPDLHGRLRRLAKKAGVSLNAFCANQLADSRARAGAPELETTVERANRLYGEHLIAVAAFGSWARGTSKSDSDVDVLIVLDRAIALRRSLYAPWDEDRSFLADHPIEVHLVHLPPAGEVVSGLWGELALDGIVLYEREFALSTRLIAIRHDILAGRIVRETAGGHPYWVLGVT